MGINHRTTNRSKAIHTEGEIENTFNMHRFLIFMTSLACTLSAPQFLSDKANDAGNNCRSEIETVFEDTEEEAVSKVICETEFRDSCETRLEPVCRNVTIGTEVRDCGELRVRGQHDQQVQRGEGAEECVLHRDCLRHRDDGHLWDGAQGRGESGGGG